MIRDRLRALLVINETPHRISFSFSVGVFIGISPLLGLHTILGILIAWIFRLNKFATVLGVYITNPWTIVPIYAFATWVGAVFLGMDKLIPDINWSHLTMVMFIDDMKNILRPFIVGTLITGFFSSVISYLTVYILLKKAHRRGMFISKDA